MHAVHKIIANHLAGEKRPVVAGEYVEAVPDTWMMGVNRNKTHIRRFQEQLNELGVTAPDRHGVRLLRPLRARNLAEVAEGQRAYIDFFRSHGYTVPDPGSGISHLRGRGGRAGLSRRARRGPGLPYAHVQRGRMRRHHGRGHGPQPVVHRQLLDAGARSDQGGTGGQHPPRGVGPGPGPARHGEAGTAGRPRKAVEFAGSAVRELNMDGRFTLCCVSTELGSMTGYIQPDDKTFEYLERLGHGSKGDPPVHRPRL